MEKVKMVCKHNQRCRYEHGYYCEDCNTFFPKESPTYRSTELLSSIWMVLHNINEELYRKGLPKDDDDLVKMKEKIGQVLMIGKEHDNYEELISEAEKIMKKYGKDSSSATIILSFNWGINENSNRNMQQSCTSK